MMAKKVKLFGPLDRWACILAADLLASDMATVVEAGHIAEDDPQGKEKRAAMKALIQELRDRGNTQ